MKKIIIISLAACSLILAGCAATVEVPETQVRTRTYVVEPQIQVGVGLDYRRNEYDRYEYNRYGRDRYTEVNLNERRNFQTTRLPNKQEKGKEEKLRPPFAKKQLKEDKREKTQ